jgi:hypothetical protein
MSKRVAIGERERDGRERWRDIEGWPWEERERERERRGKRKRGNRRRENGNFVTNFDRKTGRDRQSTWA